MTRTEAEALAKTALPCPFCGERLVVYHEKANSFNPEGEHELRHPRTLGICVLGNLPSLYITNTDIDRWNHRTAPKEQ